MSTYVHKSLYYYPGSVTQQIYKATLTYLSSHGRETTTSLLFALLIRGARQRFGCEVTYPSLKRRGKRSEIVRSYYFSDAIFYICDRTRTHSDVHPFYNAMFKKALYHM